MNITGEHGNLFNNVQTGVNGFSNIIDIDDNPHISIFGSVNAGTDMTFYVSADGVHFTLCSTISSSLPNNAQGATEFHKWFTIGARYIKVKSSNNVLATVTIQAKK